MGIGSWWRRRRIRSIAAAHRERRVAYATGYLVRQTDPRLAGVAGHAARLREPMIATVSYLDDAIDILGTTLELDAAGWQDEPRLRALFATPADVGEFLQASSDVQRWRRDPVQAGATDAWGVLGCAIAEKTVFGSELRGEVVVHDVAQTTVSFPDKRLRILSATPDGLRVEIIRRVFDVVAALALQKMTGREESRKELEQEQALLKARLTIDRRKAAALTGSGEGPDIAGLEAELAENERRLAAVRPGPEILEQGLAGLADLLARPAELIRIERTSLTLDRTNTQRAPGTAGAASFDIAQITTPEGERRALVLVHFRLAGLASGPDIAARAAKYL